MEKYVQAILKLANSCMTKVLEVNLNNGNYKTLKTDKREPSSNSINFNDWVKEVCENGFIHPDYIEVFKSIVNTDYIKKTLKFKQYIHIKYKKSIYRNNDYVDSVITIIPNDKDSCFILVYIIGE